MIDQPMNLELVWDGGLRFTANAGGNSTRLDGDRQAASSPMELLLASLAGCMAIDLVHILGRMRTPPQSVRARVEGARAESQPRRFTRIGLHFEITGACIEPASVERAIKLSRETYCSVYASLRPDMELDITYHLAS